MRVRARPRTVIWKVIAPMLALLPSAAWACPACSGRDGWSLTTVWALASMILVPFVVAGVVLRIVRRLESESNR